MNKNLQEGIALAKELNEALTADKPNCDVVICTPFIHLASVTPIVDEAIIGVGAENCADKVSGAYTGEVSAEMVASTGAKYVILGHSERRSYYGETVEILEEKVKLALANNLTPIFCIGEVLEERQAEKQNEVVAAQLASVFTLSAEDFSKIILAYEPVWAIGTGLTATPEQAQDIHAYIRSLIAEKYGKYYGENKHGLFSKLFPTDQFTLTTWEGDDAWSIVYDENGTMWYATDTTTMNADKSMVGYMMIIYIAGIQNIPGELIEAAKIDGANNRQLLRHVTLPMVMPSITICSFLTLTNSFKLFDQNLALTAGEPSNKSEMLALNIYNTFYGRTGWEGVGQAKAVIFFLAVAVIAIVQLRLTRSKEVQA